MNPDPKIQKVRYPIPMQNIKPSPVIRIKASCGRAFGEFAYRHTDLNG